MSKRDHDMPERDVERTPPDGPQNLNENRDLLVRVYERQRAENERIDQLSRDLAAGFAKIDGRFEAIDVKYVSQVEFYPVKMIVYMGAGAVLLAVLGALIAMVIINREAIKAARGAESSDTMVGRFMP